VAGHASTELTAEQLDAWRQQIAILRSVFRPHVSDDWHLLLEYPIPRRGKRIDAVILAKDVIVVVEFKCGSRKYERGARLQVEGYCLDLRDFHAGSRHRVLVPVLVATLAEERSFPSEEVIDCLASLWCGNAHSLEGLLEQAVTRYCSPNPDLIDPDQWDSAEYSPTPTIVEAARVLYEGQNVREISRCHAGAENLTKTSAAVMLAIERARQEPHKLICFVTGVPGSGKTLAGLNIVHNRKLHEGSLGVFLSGNGPRLAAHPLPGALRIPRQAAPDRPGSHTGLRDFAVTH
jgi:hypothetical protein